MMPRVRLAKCLLGIGLVLTSTASGFAQDPAVQVDAQDQEQGFEPEEIATTNTAESSGETRQTRYATLSGVELEGIRTHSIPLSRLVRTSIYRDSQPTGLLSTTVVAGNLSQRDTDHCTVTLIDVDVVMTAYHCFPGVTERRRERGFVARRAEVTFGYYTDDSQERTYPVKQVIDADPELDFAILQLDTPDGTQPPGEIFGYVHVTLDPAVDLQLRMFHHPYGAQKMVLQDATCRVVEPDGAVAGLIYHQCDTRGGSSGAAVLSYELAGNGDAKRPVAYGIHVSGRAGGLSDQTRDFNVAVPMSEVARKSRYINNIACRTVFEGLECPDTTFARPITVYFDWDKSDLNAEAVAMLNKLVEQISNASGAIRITAIQLAGFAENLPGVSAEYEELVSGRRAEAVANYLTAQGVSVDIWRRAKGSDGAPAERSEEMRRVEITVEYEYLWN